MLVPPSFKISLLNAELVIQYLLALALNRTQALHSSQAPEEYVHLSPPLSLPSALLSSVTAMTIHPMVQTKRMCMILDF